MLTSQAVLQTMKKTVKARGWTYARLAKAMDMSEPSIKRVFSGKGNLTLERLEEICDCVGADLVTVIQSSVLAPAKPKVTLEQEVELAKNIKRLIFFTALRKGFSIEKTLRVYKISEAEKNLYLKQLEELSLLERHPSDRVRILVDQSVQWIENGPVRKLYSEDMKKTFLNSNFENENEVCRFTTLLLTPETMKTLGRKIEKLIRDAQELNLLDQSVAYADKKTTTLLLASRSWTPTKALEFIR